MSNTERFEKLKRRITEGPKQEVARELPEWVTQYTGDPDDLVGHTSELAQDPDLCEEVFMDKQEAFCRGLHLATPEDAPYREMLRNLLATIRMSYYTLLVQGGEIDPEREDFEAMMDEVYGPVEREMLEAIFGKVQELTGRGGEMEFEGDRITFGERDGTEIVYAGAPGEPVGRRPHGPGLPIPKHADSSPDA